MDNKNTEENNNNNKKQNTIIYAILAFLFLYFFNSLAIGFSYTPEKPFIRGFTEIVDTVVINRIRTKRQVLVFLFLIIIFFLIVF